MDKNAWRNVCWNSNCRLPFFVCLPRKTNFCFPFPCEANRRKSTISIFRFAANKRKLLFFVSSWVGVCGCVCVRGVYVCLLFIFIFLFICCHFKQKRNLRRFPLIHLPFAHRAHRSLSFVCLLTKKQTGSYHFANGLNGLTGLYRLAHLCKTATLNSI